MKTSLGYRIAPRRRPSYHHQRQVVGLGRVADERLHSGANATLDRAHGRAIPAGDFS